MFWQVEIEPLVGDTVRIIASPELLYHYGCEEWLTGARGVILDTAYLSGLVKVELRGLPYNQQYRVFPWAKWREFVTVIPKS